LEIIDDRPLFGDPMTQTMPSKRYVVFAIFSLLLGGVAWADGSASRAGSIAEDGFVDTGALSLNGPNTRLSKPPTSSTNNVLGMVDLRTNRLTLDAVADTAPAPSDSEEADLAKKTQNPVADLISVPFQYNADLGIGANKASRSTLNIQPVIPISLNQDWNLISRTILPVIYAASPASGVSSNWGLGDTTASLFLSPKQPIGGWIIGAGPVFLIPTATDTALGSGKWGAGPTAVLLRQENGWTYGILANQIWSFAGSDSRSSVNSTFLQPFLAYTFPTYTTLGINTESTYNWTSNQWTVPINLSITQILKIGKLPVSVQLGGRYYAEGPSGGPEWGMRFTFTFLFPK
jgi:hypothetical protein